MGRAKVQRVASDQDLQKVIRQLESRGSTIVGAVPRGTPVDLIYLDPDIEHEADVPNDAAAFAFRSFMARREAARLDPCSRCSGTRMVVVDAVLNLVEPCDCEDGIAYAV